MNIANTKGHKLYTKLSDNMYTMRPYEQYSLDEDMCIINYLVYGYWKPRYLVDKRNESAVEFLYGTTLQTVTTQDVDWQSLNGLPDEIVSRARRLDARFPTSVYKYKEGVACVSWQINPDGRYYEDEDGYGMTDDEEITLYGYVDRTGKPLVAFRRIRNYDELHQMETQAGINLQAREQTPT